VMEERSKGQSGALRGQVTDLWGSPQSQAAPRFTFQWTTEKLEVRSEIVHGEVKEIRERVEQVHTREMSPASTAITADLTLDQRLKGLMWYSLYDVDFDGAWSYTHNEDIPGTLLLGFTFPQENGLYDDFRFVVDGKDMARTLRPEYGQVSVSLPVQPGQTVALEIGYESRGMDEWRYVPAPGVANLEAFTLAMTTDFADIDFPIYSMSPSSKEKAGAGWALDWDFDQVVTGHDIGMVMPVPIQPGELASKLSFSAPISLLFFFGMLFVLATLRGIEIHPINYIFLGASFFAFHLLFGYTVDHLHVVVAFALSSVVSIVLVVSYLRLVVSARFAFLESAAAQLVYLIGFSLAHFWDGFTGLTVTVLSILTLFLLMQLTGRIKWAEILKNSGQSLVAQPTAGEPDATPAR
jgi:Inner membrane protein CreD